MSEKEIFEFIELAKKCVKNETEFKKEAFSAILIGLIIKDSGQTASTNAPILENNSESTVKAMSVKEFLLTKKPKTQVEKTLCFGFFEEFHSGKEFWTPKDIADDFRTAKEQLPKNISDQIYKCRARGWVMESGKGYTLTNTGEKILNEGFSKGDKK